MAQFRKIAGVAIFIAVILLAYFIFTQKRAEAPVVNKNIVAEKENSLPAAVEEKNNLPPEVLPKKILIAVPFTTQAPFAKWDEKHEEACEEASLIMLKYYLDKKPLTPEIAEKEIQRMIDFEIKKYGDYKDSNAQQIVQLAKDFYQLDNLEVIYDFKKEDLKKYLAKGSPTIVPAAGRMLGNPNFTPPGPLYHNLVLTGYAGDAIITNDPGTRKGQNYAYNWDILYQAIHDFPGKPENITRGRKAMIVVEN